MSVAADVTSTGAKRYGPKDKDRRARTEQQAQDAPNGDIRAILHYHHHHTTEMTTTKP